MSTFYKPLTEFHSALDALENIYSQQQRTEYENALKIYTSRDDPNTFSQEEATQIFPALFVVGKSYILCTNSFDVGFQWFAHAMIFGKKAELNIDFAPHYVEMADFFSEENKQDQSLLCIDKALEIFDSAQELDDKKVIMKGHALMTKGFLQQEMDDLNGAAENFAQSVIIFEGLSDFEEATQYLLDAYELLANVHYERKNQTEAHLYSIKGLEFMDKALGLDNPRGENLARKLAYSLLEQKRSEEALVYVKKWGNMTVKEHGKNSPMMAQCYFLHGKICSDLGEHADALKKIEQAEKVSKDDGEIYILKCRCHFNLKNYKEAKECLNQALEFTKAKFESNSKELAECYLVGAEIFKDSFPHKEEAKEYYSKSLEMYRNLGTACILETVTTIISFGNFLSSNHEFQDIMNLVPEAIEICQNYLPTQRTLLETCLSILGSAQTITGNCEKGIENMETAAKICEETGNESGMLVTHYYSLAHAYSRDRLEIAQEYGKRILEMELEKNGKGSQMIINTIQLLWHVYAEANNIEEWKELEAIYK